MGDLDFERQLHSPELAHIVDQLREALSDGRKIKKVCRIKSPKKLPLIIDCIFFSGNKIYFTFKNYSSLYLESENGKWELSDNKQILDDKKKYFIFKNFALKFLGDDIKFVDKITSTFTWFNKKHRISINFEDFCGLFTNKKLNEIPGINGYILKEVSHLSELKENDIIDDEAKAKNVYRIIRKTIIWSYLLDGVSEGIDNEKGEFKRNLTYLS